nr:acetylornithine deacetylase [uncultured Cohaesibacter sp.]
MTQKKAIEFISKLVSFDTNSAKSNLDLVNFVKDYLAGFDIESTLVFNDDKTKANLFAVIGPNVEGGIILSGHSDCVPVEGQPWDTDPFTVVEKDGYLYGRGVADMKSFSAINLSLVPEMVKADLKKPIILALSYDEEIGCVGAPSMIEEIVKQVPKPAAAIVGEPTLMKMVNAHKGINVYKTTITGQEAHSSKIHLGVSAVMTAAKLVCFLEGQLNHYKEHSFPDSGFEPPYTTVHVGMIEGGTAANIVSRECSFYWDVRDMPWDKISDIKERFDAYCAELLEEMRKVAPGCDIVTEVIASAPPLSPEQEGAAEAICRHLTGQNIGSVVPYGTEGGQFQEAGISTIVCGPGSINQAHKANEFIKVSEVDKAVDFVTKLIALQTNN